MDYTLALLTHGDARTFRRSVESFVEKVSPPPGFVVVFLDGSSGSVIANARHVLDEELPEGVEYWLSSRNDSGQLGFCGATARLWHLVSAWDRLTPPPRPFAFWLEADFVFLRDVNLESLAAVIRENPMLAQMALIRDVANADEARAGGLVASRPGEFMLQMSDTGQRWMRQTSYFTTNPSLMRASFMRDEPFLDDGEPYCEGRYGIGLRDRGYYFGAWGSGEEWVGHMGIRDNSGFGY